MVKDDVTGEMMSKNALKKLQKKRAADAKKAEKKAAAEAKAAAEGPKKKIVDGLGRGRRPVGAAPVLCQ